MPAVGTDLVLVERDGVLHKAAASEIAALGGGGSGGGGLPIGLSSAIAAQQFLN